MCATYFIDDGTATEMLEIINSLNQKYGYETVTYDQIYPDGAPQEHDVYPKMAAPVGAFQDGQITVLMPTWGFPRKDSGEVGFNARSDNVCKYRTWSAAYEENRVFAPARGFYENKKISDQKPERYCFNDPSGELLFIAAIMAEFKDKNNQPYYA